MVVFVPEMLENVAEFTRQVYAQAAAQQRKVLYLAINGQEKEKLVAARQLATIVALTQGAAVQASAAQVEMEDRADLLRESTHPGDIVVWPEECWLAPASLEHELGITQRVLTGIYTTAAPEASPWYRPVLFWLTGLVLLAVFSYLEFSAGRLMSGGALKVALLLLFTFELGAFYQWDRLFH
jgi:hypothetical protein